MPMFKSAFAEQRAAHARQLLQHYFDQVDSTGSVVYGDCALEIAEIVDTIIDAAVAEALEAVKRQQGWASGRIEEAGAERSEAG